MADLPEPVVMAARAMTKAARRGTHPDSAQLRQRRQELLGRYGYAARVREDDPTPTLVCYPQEWMEGGVFQPDRMESTADAVERPLRPDRTDDGWAAIDAHNRKLAETVADRFGEPHGETAAAFGTYMANHHEARVETATASHVEAFRSDYFPRNAWPTEDQTAAIDTSLELLFEVAGVADPPLGTPD